MKKTRGITGYAHDDARARHIRLRASGIALALVMPLTLITVVGCASVRTCAASNSSGGAKPSVTLTEPLPARTPEIQAEGSFSGALGGDVSGKRVVLRGRVEMRGNAPHEAAAFSVEDGSRTYALFPDTREREARALQGHLVDLTATLLEDGTLCPLSWKIVN
jgi:hypothetical protein